MTFSYVPLAQIQAVRQTVQDPIQQATLLATFFRLNTLYMIAQAGSGHIGSSFSAMDMATWLWTQVMQDPNNVANPNRDVYFSSKGHDAPGLYSILIGLEKLPWERIHTLRRLHGLPGHPDVGTPYMATNTGSLGMGVAKARGMAMARRLNKQSGHFYVLTGDGELQEGQIWESLQPTANHKFAEITVIVDHNKMQSDTWVKNVSDLGDLVARFKAHGWEVARHDGHDLKAFAETLAHFRTVKDRPQVLIADTIKGKGVSFMESTALGEDESLYKFHSGAPSADNYEKALAELVASANQQLHVAGLPDLKLETAEALPRFTPSAQAQKLVPAYGDELVKLAQENKDLVALDGDLMLDTGLIPFKAAHPERFIECGIAEQDMVSMAGGLALSGKLPVVHSFACFLTPRPNEHIYNNATEHTKIIYTGSLAGAMPAGPGHSHQSLRDIALLASIPGMTLIAPANEQETRLAIRWAVEQNSQSTYIRLESLPTEIPYTLPADHQLKPGYGTVLQEGKDVAILAYGPTLTAQAYLAAQQLTTQSISTAAINLPWLNLFAPEWVEQLAQYRLIVALDNHYVMHGQGMALAAALVQQLARSPRVINIGLHDVPVGGQNDEMLAFYGLDVAALVQQVKQHYQKLAA